MNISSDPATINPDICDAPPQPKPNEGQTQFMEGVFLAMVRDTESVPRIKLSGGPGVGKSFTIAKVAQEAADHGWVVFLIGPTHQATGVLAAAVPMSFPFEPDPKNMLRAGEVMFCTAHKLGKWVQKSRAKGAVQGERDPVPRDSWLGRSFRADWSDPPEGALVIADETSMYPGQMVGAIESTLRTLKEACGKVVFVAVGDPHQLTPVRGPSYTYTEGEGPESPSELVQERGFDKSYHLTENMRAKDPALRNVVQTYLTHKTVPVPPPDSKAYRWTEANSDFYHAWADMVKEKGEAKTVMLGYRRATVAFANDRVCQILYGTPAYELQAGRKMRVQETYSPTGRTLAASSDLIEVVDVMQVEDAVLDLILPPQKGFAAAHDDDVLEIMKDLIDTDLEWNGPFPVAQIKVFGDRAGMLNNVPVQVASEHNTDTPTETRWASLQSVVSQAAFRRNHKNDIVRRGLAAIFYHLADNAMMKIEAPFAMTSHRAQGSTYANVAVLADGMRGGRVVDHRVESARDASAYVMLSRASESLTIAWAPRLSPGGPFAF